MNMVTSRDALQATEERPDVARYFAGDVVVVVARAPSDREVVGAFVVEGAIVQGGRGRLSAAILVEPEVPAAFTTLDLDDFVGRAVLHHDGDLCGVVTASRTATSHGSIASEPVGV